MQLAVPRYTTRGLPKYRYLPTVHPHPGIHPEGHSYGKKEEKHHPLPPEKWSQNDLYLYGVDLFNQGFWWEAHEAWESVWLTTKKLDLHGQFLQALIQFSAALLKLYSGKLSGFEKLYQEAEKRIGFCLKELPGNLHLYMGLNIVKWMERMENFRQTVEDPKGEVIDPLGYTNFPAIILESHPAKNH